MLGKSVHHVSRFLQQGDFFERLVDKAMPYFNDKHMLQMHVTHVADHEGRLLCQINTPALVIDPMNLS